MQVFHVDDAKCQLSCPCCGQNQSHDGCFIFSWLSYFNLGEVELQFYSVNLPWVIIIKLWWMVTHLPGKVILNDRQRFICRHEWVEHVTGKKCMLNSDLRIIIKGRMTTLVNSFTHALAHVKSSLVCGGVTSRLYSWIECRQTFFNRFVPSTEILFHTRLVLLLTPVV